MAAGIPFSAIWECCRRTCAKKAVIAVKGKNESEQQALLADADALVEAGAFAIVLELVTAPVAKELTRAHSHPDDRHRRGQGLRWPDPRHAGFAGHVAMVSVSST